MYVYVLIGLNISVYNKFNLLITRISIILVEFVGDKVLLNMFILISYYVDLDRLIKNTFA